jgi:hypothetical protein
MRRGLGDLAALVEVGLVRVAEDGRPALLETVREFAAERLERGHDLRRRHAEHYLALAEHARSFARGPREREWIDRLTVELDNLRAAPALWLESGKAPLGLRLADALEPLWIRGMRQRERSHGASRCSRSGPRMLLARSGAPSSASTRSPSAWSSPRPTRCTSRPRASSIPQRSHRAGNCRMTTPSRWLSAPRTT